MSLVKVNSDTVAKLAGRISFLMKRQDVFTTNIANQETPNYKAREIEFKGFLDDNVNQQRNIIDRNLTQEPDIKEKIVLDNPKPNGNTVNLEEQMANVADNSVEFMVATEVLKRNMALVKLAVQS